MPSKKSKLAGLRSSFGFKGSKTTSVDSQTRTHPSSSTQTIGRLEDEDPTDEVARTIETVMDTKDPRDLARAAALLEEWGAKTGTRLQEDTEVITKGKRPPEEGAETTLRQEPELVESLAKISD